METLTSQQKRFLRGLGHHLDPVVLVGHQGVTEAVCLKTRRELEAHELIKVRVIDSAPDGAREISDDLAHRTGAALVQVIGHTLLLYRAHPEEPKIALPAQPTSKPAPRAKSASTSAAGKGGANR